MPAKKKQPSKHLSRRTSLLPSRRSHCLDDIDHVHDFFTWKIASVMNDKVKDRWAQAFRVAKMDFGASRT
ncbi:hypothetical protein V8E54_009997 [Elaphomyces granulatus]